MSLKIAIGSDHGGYELKKALTEHLTDEGYTVHDFGCDDQTSCDYPDYAHAVAKSVSNGEFDRGIVVCTTGVGVSMVANKVKNIRCGLCLNPTMARLTREHNDANVLALAGGLTGKFLGLQIADVFLSTQFSNGENHVRRIKKMTEYEASEN